jgi:uncharacterized protein (DUF736 family)
VKCAAGVDASGRLVPDAHEQGRWRPEYRVCCGDTYDAGDGRIVCPECGEEYTRDLRAGRSEFMNALELQIGRAHV